MGTQADLKLRGAALVDGRPLACAECGNTFSLEVHKRTLFEIAPAWVCCLACGHGGEHQGVTNGLVDAVLSGWVRRRRSADRDTFTATWRGTVMSGQLLPTMDVYQAIGAAQAVRDGATPEVKRWWRGKKRQAKNKVKRSLRVARGRAQDTVDTAKAGALTTAWTLQTGGAGPTTRRRARRCTVKGCRRGMVTIRTRFHSTTGKTQKVQVPCGVCHRSERMTP